jgi:hypothetical protein
VAPLRRRGRRAPRARRAAGRSVDAAQGLERLRAVPEPRDGLRLALRLPGLRPRPQGPGGGGPRGRRRADARPPVAAGPGAGLVPQPHRPGARPRRLLTGRGRGAPVRGEPRRPPSRARLAGVRQHPRADGAREPGRWLPRVDRLHAHHLGATRHDGRGAEDRHRPGSRPPLVRLPQHGPDLPLQGPARRDRGARRRQRVPAPRLAGQRRPRLCRPPLQGPLRRLDAGAARVAARGLGEPGAPVPVAGRHASCLATPRRRPRASCRATGTSAASATSSCATDGARTPRGSSWPAGRTSPSTITSTPPTSSSTERATWRSTAAPTTRTPRARTTSTTTGGPWPTTRCSCTSRASASSGARTGGRRRTTAARGWTPPASGTACAASRTGAARGTCGTVARSPRSPPRPRTATPAPTPPAPTSRPSSSGSRGSSCTCGRPNVLVVLDRVRATDPSYRKAWLLHGVSEPRVESPAAGTSVGHGGTSYRNASTVTFEDGEGRLRVHALLPAERDVIVRGGPGFEFWTPGDERGGAWGSGQNWPLDPPEGGPLPEDPYLLKMWKTFWDGIDRLSPSNRRAVVPGAWRMETSPATPRRRRTSSSTSSRSATATSAALSRGRLGDRGTRPRGGRDRRRRRRPLRRAAASRTPRRPSPTWRPARCSSPAWSRGSRTRSR